MFYHHQKRGQIHTFSCTSCDAGVTVDFSKVKNNYIAKCRKCGTEYPFNKSDERLIRAQKKHIK